MRQLFENEFLANMNVMMDVAREEAKNTLDSHWERTREALREETRKRHKWAVAIQELSRQVTERLKDLSERLDRRICDSNQFLLQAKGQMLQADNRAETAERAVQVLQIRMDKLNEERKTEWDLILKYMDSQNDLEKKLEEELKHWGDRVIKCEEAAKPETLEALEDRLTRQEKQTLLHSAALKELNLLFLAMCRTVKELTVDLADLQARASILEKAQSNRSSPCSSGSSTSTRQ